jgi:transposase
MGYIKGEDRNQIILFPESIDEYISENSSVRVIDAYVDQIDIEKLGFQKAVTPTVGRPPYHPKDLLKLYLYGYLNRVRSSRRLEEEATRNIEVIWLLKKLKPDFKTIADFRKDNKSALKQTFRDFSKLCNEWNLYGKELAAIDGSKFRACNSKKNNYSSKKLARLLRYIDEKINRYMNDLDKGDIAESADRKPDTEEIKKRIEELNKRKEKYQTYQQQLAESGKSEISTTDPDAKMMCNNNNNVDIGYNVQMTVDAKHKLIADFKVTQNANDMGELDHMALRAKKLFRVKRLEVLADKGYYKITDLKKCVRKGVIPYVMKQTFSNGTGDKEFYPSKFKYDKERNLYICPAEKELYFFRMRKAKGKVLGADYRNTAACQECEFKDRCTSNIKGRSIFRHVDQDFLDTIDLNTKTNTVKYQLRQTIVEHPFGTIKRAWGAYYFLTKRKVSVKAEIALVFLAYNFKRVINILGTQAMLRLLRREKNR